MKTYVSWRSQFLWLKCVHLLLGMLSIYRVFDKKASTGKCQCVHVMSGKYFKFRNRLRLKCISSLINKCASPRNKPNNNNNKIRKKEVFDKHKIANVHQINLFVYLFIFISGKWKIQHLTFGVLWTRLCCVILYIVIDWEWVNF